MNFEEYITRGYNIDRYYMLEEDCLKFLDCVTLGFYSIQERKNINSLYLADLLLRIGSNVEILFKEYIASMPDKESIIKEKTKEEWNWGHYKQLEFKLQLSKESIIINATLEEIFPFKNTDGAVWESINQKDDNKFWWKSYNQVKHNASFEEANLENIIRALAALFMSLSRNSP